MKVPSLTTILRIAIALNCKVMDLVGAYDKTDIRSLIGR
jgi:DNA-binding Xre family transcriptional regulator